jgi:hypothetical protein
MLLTSSHDSSVKLYQFPIFWPAEMIRKNKTKQTIIDEPRSIDLVTPEDTLDDLTHEFGNEIKLPRDITDQEIYSEDLDGWDE